MESVAYMYHFLEFDIAGGDLRQTGGKSTG